MNQIGKLLLRQPRKGDVYKRQLVDRFLSKNAYIENNWKRSDDLIYLVKKCRTPNDYTAYMKSLQNRLNNFLRSEKDYESAVMKAMQYIERHYSDHLSLEEVAAEVHLNPTYLSRIFSQETGCSFIAYLTAGLRIERGLVEDHHRFLAGADAIHCLLYTSRCV